MKHGAISLPAAACAFTYMVVAVSIINVFDLGDLYPQTSQWMLVSIAPIMIGLGITAVVTGTLGKNRDEVPRMAVVGCNMGIATIVIGGSLLAILILFGYL